MNASAPYVVAAVRDPKVAALLDYIRSGEHSGETWNITLTELEAEQTNTWYLQAGPRFPSPTRISAFEPIISWVKAT